MNSHHITTFMTFVVLVACAPFYSCPTRAAEDLLGLNVDADTMIAIDANSNAFPPPVGSNANNGFNTPGIEQQTPFGSQPFMHIRGGDPLNPGSITAKPLIRFDLGLTGGVNLDTGLPYFVELETHTNANSNDTFRIYAIDDVGTRSFGEGSITWDNAPAVATESFQDFEAAGDEVGIFFRPNPDSADLVGTRLRHPLMGSQINTHTNGANTFATFGITSTETNRWVIKSKEAGAGDGARLFTYDVTESSGDGTLTSGSTWGGSAPAVANLYRVNSGHSVSVDGSGVFNGEGVVVNSGTLNFTANDVAVPLIVLNAGGNLTNSTGSSLSIGDPTATEADIEVVGGGLILNKDFTYNASAGQENLDINIPLISYDDFTFNGVAGSNLTLRYPASHRGTINFDGAGDDVVINRDWGIGGTLVMNATGTNAVRFSGDDSEQEFDKGKLTFNQPGTIDHNSDDDGIGSRLQGVGNLEVSSPVTVDLTKTFPITPGGGSTDDRRFLVTRNLTGSAPITVQGTAANPTGQNNQFEIGANTARFTDVREVGYSGTITTQDFAIVEAHAGLPNAKVVVNSNGLLAAGFIPHENAPHQLEPTVKVGEIVLAAETSAGAGDGGGLDVGYRSGGGARAPQNLRLTTEGGQNGNLTMGAGSSLNLQINGTPNHIPPVPGDSGNCSETYDTQTLCQYGGPVFDTIEIEGNAFLDGELVVHLNSDVPFSTAPSGTSPPDPFYTTFSVGDTWDIITAVESSLTADFDGLNGVTSADLAVWESAYGSSDTGDADGDGDTDGGDFLIWQRQLGMTASMGNLSGTFDSMTPTIVDSSPVGFKLTDQGLTFRINYVSSSLVQLELISMASQASVGVPEPSSALLACCAWIGLGLFSKRRRR